MQAVREVIQIDEPRRDARHHPVLRQRLDLVQGDLDQLRQGLIVLGRLPLGDLVDLLLGPVDDVVDVAGRLVALSLIHI